MALPSWGSSSKPLPLAQVTPPVQPPWGQLGGPWTTDTLTTWAAPSRHIPAPTPQPATWNPTSVQLLGGIDPHHHNTENMFQNHVSEHFYFGKDKLPFTCPHRGHCIPTAHRLPGKDSCWPSPGWMVLGTEACPLCLPVSPVPACLPAPRGGGYSQVSHTPSCGPPLNPPIPMKTWTHGLRWTEWFLQSLWTGPYLEKEPLQT